MTVHARTAVLLGLGMATMCAFPCEAASVESARTAKLESSDIGNLSIAMLIKQLGSDQFFLRRQAESELVRRGADAFDLLQQAESHPDLEIAASAHYILQQIRIEWTDPNDPAEVKAIMHRYGDLSHDERVEKIDAIAALDDDAGLRALCRIARFEPSSRTARHAALKAMRSTTAANRASEAASTIRSEIGGSLRTPAEWLLTYAEQIAHPERVADRWLDLIDEEAALVAQESPHTETALLFRLLAFHLDLCQGANQPDATFANLTRRTDLIASQKGDFAEFLTRVQQGMTLDEQREFLGPAFPATWLLQDAHREEFGVAYAMNWLWETEQWPALAMLEERYAEAIRNDRLLLYFSAAARWKQGRDQVAEELADRAFSLQADDNERRTTVGDVIGEMGRHDWAEREWWFAIDNFPVLDGNSLYARRSLAIFRLHDRGDDARAANLMEEIIQAVEADRDMKGAIMGEPNRRKAFNVYRAQKEYFLSCEAAEEGDYIRQRKHLDASFSLDPDDADVLIAMYNSPGADEAYHAKVAGYVQVSASKVAERIEQDPDSAQNYNHWAWLVSNTEGDFAQAVKYSLRSLELDPGNPSYLDTLGRCYYAVGDYENAVQVERKAVRLHPHLQVMRDQLQLFESELAQQHQK